MDYGKAAYLRTEEITRRLDVMDTPKKENGCGVSAQPEREIKSGRSLTFATLSGSGTVCLTVKVTATVFDCGTLYLTVNGKTACFTEFSFLGKSEGILPVSVKTDGLSSLSLVCKDGLFARIHRVEAIAFGADVSLSGFDGCSGADTCINGGGISRTGVAYCRGDRLYFALFDSLSGEKLGETALGGGTAADVARYGADGFAIAFRDGFGGLWAARTDFDGNVSGRVFLGVSGDGVAIESYGEGFAFSYVREGKVYVLYTREGLWGIMGENEVNFGAKAENAVFVKSASVLTLLIGSKGKIFLKEAVTGVDADAIGELSVFVQIS